LGHLRLYRRRRGLVGEPQLHSPLPLDYAEELYNGDFAGGALATGAAENPAKPPVALDAPAASPMPTAARRRHRVLSPAPLTWLGHPRR